ncbi:transmembrane protein 244-like isoform X2 [Cynoglossus semilaevis]|uniref:transmembrane protein 244-like isoform X2 n=1 Tax=Cynoglossus semilaevis TaxID=244447 RepID=UPI0007DCB318|nr:transmembrane protein 244-like isoform X2 [Cynoglossus semilaevis]
MAFKGKAVDSKTVLLNLLLCLLIFYSLFYMIGSVCFGAFRMDHFDGLIPFDFKTEPADSNSKYLVNLLSLELTFFCSGLLFAAVVRRRVWDYALTVTLLHVGITSLGESTSDGLHPSPRPTWNLEEWPVFNDLQRSADRLLQLPE